MSNTMKLSLYRGDGSVLLAFDVSEELAPRLAGFAIECTPPKGDSYKLVNRLSFEQEITAETTPEQREWTPTDEAPIQRFHWIDFPRDVPPGTFKYRATAMLFVDGTETELESGPSDSGEIDIREEGYPKFEVGFTRGYVSSQAYATKFKNAPLVPAPQSGDFDTAPFATQYKWLGSHARKLVFALLEETAADPDLSLDVFAYDFDEPDIARALAGLGSRLRLYLDNHDVAETKGAALRKKEALAVVEAGVDGKYIRRGDFGRYAHDKIFIQRRRNGAGDYTAVKVLSGSANFSIRGLYVQSNNVFVFEDETTAGYYEDAFEQAWNDPAGFDDSEVAAGWFPPSDEQRQGLPRFQVSFAPHADPEVSLRPVADAILAAKSSVLFSIMDVDAGGGPVLEAINGLGGRPELYAFGTTQNVAGGLNVKGAGAAEPVFVPFSFLKSKVPPPFKAEFGGGPGQVIHHKFVVVDFNGDNPAVFAGSSNLAKGGEEDNGDNLLAFRDPQVACLYAVEAIKLIDHYRFRAAMQEASKAEPLTLKPRSANWAADYFDPDHPKCRERKLFAK
jgi:hypothetical protein